MGTNVPSDIEDIRLQYEALKKLVDYRRNIGNKFIERMHYDFNTLLNSITGYIYAVHETADHAQKPSIDGALKTSKALLNKFSDMTDYLSLVLGGYELNTAPASFRQIIRQVNQEFDDAISEKNLSFNCEIEESIPEYVKMDGSIVKKAVALLVENAVQNSQSGTINVSVLKVSEDADRITVKISVSDEGTGVDVEAIKRVLNGEEHETSPAYKGGLGRFGLQIAKDFLQCAGSRLDVENNSKKGATFSLELTVERVNFAALAQAEEEPTQDKGGALSGIKVLFADDSVIIQQIVVQMLEGEGASVTVASNGQEAVDVFSENKFDLVLMDVEMPVLNGCDATRQIKDAEKTGSASVPIIGMTAHTKQEEFDRCIESGMSGVVVKPFKHKSLMDAIFKELFQKEYEASQQEELTQEKSIYNFELIKGIDYKEGLKRLSGNEKVYFELLQNFRDGYSDTPANISALLKEGNDNEVKNLLHLIKGISGNLSFNEVYDYANLLRDAVDKDDLSEITKYLKLFDEAVNDFNASFGAVEVEILYSMSELEDMDLLLVKTRLNELMEYISGDVDIGSAVDACDDIYDYMKETDYEKGFMQIKDALNSFDVDLAVSLLKSFIDKFI